MLGAGSDDVAQRLKPALVTFAQTLTAQADAKGDRLRAKLSGTPTGFSA
jgi:5-(carboxyamino)imidazole ribonucleotide mutase